MKKNILFIAILFLLVSCDSNLNIKTKSTAPSDLVHAYSISKEEPIPSSLKSRTSSYTVLDSSKYIIEQEKNPNGYISEYESYIIMFKIVLNTVVDQVSDFKFGQEFNVDNVIIDKDKNYNINGQIISLSDFGISENFNIYNVVCRATNENDLDKIEIVFEIHQPNYDDPNNFLIMKDGFTIEGKNNNGIYDAFNIIAYQMDNNFDDFMLINVDNSQYVCNREYRNCKIKMRVQNETENSKSYYYNKYDALGDSDYESVTVKMLDTNDARIESSVKNRSGEYKDIKKYYMNGELIMTTDDLYIGEKNIIPLSVIDLKSHDILIEKDSYDNISKAFVDVNDDKLFDSEDLELVVDDTKNFYIHKNDLFDIKSEIQTKISELDSITQIASEYEGEEITTQDSIKNNYKNLFNKYYTW